MIIKRETLYDMVSNLCIGEYAIGMHGIDLSRMKELNKMSKEEGITNILKKGLKVHSDRTINGTVKFFGRIDTEEDRKKVREGLTDYRYGSDELIIVSIPTILKTSDGRKLFLGCPNLKSRYKDNMGTTGYEKTTLLDDVIMEKGIIKPEYILGRCKILDRDNIEFTINPNHISLKNGIVSHEYYEKIREKIITTLFETGIDISIFEKFESVDEEKINIIISRLENKIKNRDNGTIPFRELEEAFICETLHQLLKEKKLTKRVININKSKLLTKKLLNSEPSNNNIKINNIQNESEFLKVYKSFLQLKDEKEKNKYLTNDSFVISALKYLDEGELSFFFFCNHSHFNKDLLNRIEIMKPLALKLFNAIQYSNLKIDLEAMREIASQKGIHPMIMCYVDPTIRNDPQFISNIIVNTNLINDFYGISAGSLKGSNMVYGTIIGKDIQTNPMFWEMLNAMLKKDNPKNSLFDTKKEIEIAKNHFSKVKENNFERTSFNSDKEEICITLKKGEYDRIKDTYYIKYDYTNTEQCKYMLNVFMKGLVPAIGSQSYRSKKNLDYILPYFVDEFGLYTDSIYKAKAIGGTNIPEDLLYEFIRRMVEKDKCIIKCGELIMKDKFSPEILEYMVKNLNNRNQQKK